MKISSATISKTGKRSNNEDAFCVIDEQTEGRWLGIVCDGMGGHAMGEVASETVVKAILKPLRRTSSKRGSWMTSHPRKSST